MALLNFPYRPISGDSEVVEQIVADLDHLQDGINGGLQASTNFKVAAASTPLSGSSSAEGTSDSAARADHQHVIRGVEQLATQPTADHFAGRVYFNTTSNKHFVCIDPLAPTYEAFSNIDAADTVVHGARHGVGGADELPDLGVSSDMLGRSIATTNLSADTNNIGTSWTTIVTGSQFALPGSQAVTVNGSVYVLNGTGGEVRLSWRIIDTDNANAFVMGRANHSLTTTGLNYGIAISGIAQLATGNHTLRLQFARTGGGAGLDARQTLASGAIDGQTFTSGFSTVVG